MRCCMNSCSVMVAKTWPCLQSETERKNCSSAPEVTLFAMNLDCVYVISAVPVGHINYTVCHCSWPWSHHAELLWQIRGLLSLLCCSLKLSWVNLTLHSQIYWVTFQVEVLWSTPLWVDFLYGSWIDELCFPERIQKTPCFFCWLYHSVRCNNSSSVSRICSHLELIGIDDCFLTFYLCISLSISQIQTQQTYNNMFLCHADAMSWIELRPHIINSSCSLAPSGVFSKTYKS